MSFTFGIRFNLNRVSLEQFNTNFDLNAATVKRALAMSMGNRFITEDDISDFVAHEALEERRVRRRLQNDWKQNYGDSRVTGIDCTLNAHDVRGADAGDIQTTLSANVKEGIFDDNLRIASQETGAKDLENAGTESIEVTESNSGDENGESQTKSGVNGGTVAGAVLGTLFGIACIMGILYEWRVRNNYDIKYIFDVVKASSANEAPPRSRKPSTEGSDFYDVDAEVVNPIGGQPVSIQDRGKGMSNSYNEDRKSVWGRASFTDVVVNPLRNTSKGQDKGENAKSANEHHGQSGTEMKSFVEITKKPRKGTDIGKNMDVEESKQDTKGTLGKKSRSWKDDDDFDGNIDDEIEVSRLSDAIPSKPSMLSRLSLRHATESKTEGYSNGQDDGRLSSSSRFGGVTRESQLGEPPALPTAQAKGTPKSKYSPYTPS